MRRRTIVGFTTTQLIDSLAYIGYSTRSWDSNIRSFVLGVKNQTYIFDLNLTILFLKNALSFFFEICIKRGVCALLNENEMFSQRFNAYFDAKIIDMFKHRRLVIVSKKLERGLLTNRKMFKTRLETFRTFPHVFFISSPMHSSFFVEESRILAIPSISVCDTIYFPFSAPYIIPANEKSFKTILLLNTLFYLYFMRAFMLRSRLFKQRIVARVKHKCIKTRSGFLKNRLKSNKTRFTKTKIKKHLIRKKNQSLDWVIQTFGKKNEPFVSNTKV